MTLDGCGCIGHISGVWPTVSLKKVGRKSQESSILLSNAW